MVIGTNYGNASTAIEFVPRTDTSEMWNRVNPVLASGEMGRDSTLNRIKFGDGRTRWRDLPYATGDGRAGPRGARGLDGAANIGTGWGAYVHTGAPQVLLSNTKVTLTNNAGTILHTEKPSDIAAFYSGGLITGRTGDSIAIGIELTFTPSDGTASSLYLAIDIGGAVGEIYPDDFAVLKGQNVPHRISYNVTAYTLDTWVANGGAIKILPDGPGVASGMRYVIHRLHKA